MDKHQQRQNALIIRQNISDKKNKSAIIMSKLFDYLNFHQMVGIYYNTSDEVYTTPWISFLAGFGYQICLPKVEKQKLSFYRFSPTAKLVKSSFGIMEPTASEVIALSLIDVLVIPLVAFDNQGNRLGMGKGYYDSLLKDYQGLKIGVAYEMQKQDLIVTEDHDQQLDIIITEENIYQFK